MRERLASGFDFSCPEQWMVSHAAVSQALDAIAYVHPLVCSASLRWDFLSKSLVFHLEQKRHLRSADIVLPAGRGADPAGAIFPNSLAESLARHWPGAPEQALSLGRLLRELSEAFLGLEAHDLLWALPLGRSLGLGRSERWDPSHADGLDRLATDSIALFEASAMASAEAFPSLALGCAQAGSRFLQSEARDACASLLSELEADALELQSTPLTTPQSLHMGPRL